MEIGVIQSDNNPLEYPWKKPAWPGVMDATGYRRMIARPGRRISSALVARGEAWMSIERDAYERQRIPPSHRYLVLAVGSNASLDVMRNKFNRRGINTPKYMPHVPAVVENILVTAFADISQRGYIAATPVHSDGAVAKLWASWLDQAQMAALDSTEPGYACRWISAEDYPIAIHATSRGFDGPATEYPAGCYIYDAERGALPFGGELMPLATQSEMFARLREAPDFADLFSGSDEEVVQRYHDADACAAFRARIDDLGIARPTGIRGEAHPDLATRHNYGHTPDMRSRVQHDPRLYSVVRSRDSLVRAGEQHIVVDRQLGEVLGDHAEIRAAVGSNKGRGGVIVRVDSADDVQPDTIESDQMVRDALGVKLQDAVEVRPVTLTEQSRLADVFVAPRYLLTRVQVADHSNAETDTALMDPQTMKILGLDEGDVAVIEGPANENGQVRTLRMRVCSASEQILADRRAISAAGGESRYASADLMLGVYPDLPWLFIDASARDALGVNDGRLGTVRVRASRRQKMFTEMRELMLVLAVSIIGIVSITDSVIITVAMFLFVILVTSALSIAKVRARLGRPGRNLAG